MLMANETRDSKMKNSRLLHLGMCNLSLGATVPTDEFQSPAYAGLTNNVGTKLQELKGFPWPEGTPDYVSVRVKQDYIQSYSRHFGIERLTRYNTRVEKLHKKGHVWQLESTSLIREGKDAGKKLKATEVTSTIGRLGT